MLSNKPQASNWYCVITNPQCQTRAQLGLGALGYRTFVPKHRRWVSHARVRKAVEKPLLNRYVFVEVDTSHASAQSFGEVKGVNGVEGLVSICGRPAIIPRVCVEDFLRRYMAGEWDDVAKEPLPIGARVRVLEGQFRDLLATVTGVKAGKVSAKILGTNDYLKVYKASVSPWYGEAA